MNNVAGSDILINTVAGSDFTNRLVAASAGWDMRRWSAGDVEALESVLSFRDVSHPSLPRDTGQRHAPKLLGKLGKPEGNGQTKAQRIAGSSTTKPQTRRRNRSRRTRPKDGG